MEMQARIPFQNMTPRRWLNLALAGLLLFYSLYMVWQVLLHMMCGQIGVDYCEYWSAGRVANLYGYARVYNVQTLGQIQKGIFPATADPSQIAVVPFLYLPVFVLPFQLLSRLSPEIGYWIWTAFNATALILYLRFFIRALHLEPPPPRLILMLFACLPVFMSLFTGQMDVWLVVCVGEFMRYFLDRRPFQAGLWLGGLLLKPQLLLLVGLVLLLQRSIKILAGLASTSILVLIECLLLGGPVGLIEMIKLWLAYGNGGANIWVEGMMNWRMLGLQLSNVTSPAIGWGLTTAGILATTIITLDTWRKPFNSDSPSFPIALLGILAASALVAWHAHIHMAMIVIPPLLYLYQTKVLPERLLDYWVFLPSSLYTAMVFIPESLMAMHILSNGSLPLIYFFIGAGEFSANFSVFWWAVRASHPTPALIPQVA